MMAAPTQQPEMAELSGGHTVQPSATALQDGRGALEGSTSSGTAAASSDAQPEHVMISTDDHPLQPALHPLQATSNNDDGIVRGADNELPASTNADNATITSQRSEEKSKGIASVQSAPINAPTEPVQGQKAEVAALKTDFDAPRDGQEKGDQVTIELVSACRP